MKIHKGQKIFVVAIPALHPGEAAVQVATVQVPVNNLLEVRPSEAVRPFEPLLVDLNKGLISFFEAGKVTVKEAPESIEQLVLPIQERFQDFQSKYGGGRLYPGAQPRMAAQAAPAVWMDQAPLLESLYDALQLGTIEDLHQ